MPNRRDFMKATGAAGIAMAAGVTPADAQRHEPDLLPPLDRPTGAPEVVARDEAYWGRVRAYYRTAVPATNLEGGYFGMMAAPVLAAFHANVDLVNTQNSWYARREYTPKLLEARARVAATLGCAPTELAFSRGATEALQCLIGQYRGVGAGDAVCWADTDYDAMQWAMNALAERRGARVVRITMPEPLTRDAVLATYDKAFRETPRLRLVLLTHLNNKHGGIVPVKEIVAMARARGIDAIVDAAHSFGQCRLSLADLGADFVGANLHKWFGAPVGAGVLYIRASRLDAIDRHFADEALPLSNIGSRIHTGTTNFATVLTVPAALDFHEAVGPAYKAARLRHLRDRWVTPARAIRGVDVLTADGPDDVAAITSFRLHGRGDRASVQATHRALLDRFGIFTQPRTGLAGGDCIRVTPALYNTPADADRLVAALGALASA
jgi:selenocysteine lyase/cysteine desulfurase